MTANNPPSFWTLFLSLLSKLEAGDSPNLPKEESNGFDVVGFFSNSVPQTMKAHGMEPLPTSSAFIAEQSEISRQAAIKVGCPDGHIPSESFSDFMAAEDELGRQASQLGRQLRDRSVQLGRENSPFVSYLDSFDKDPRSREIIDQALQSGVPPTLVESVKSKLIEEEKALWGEATDFMRSSLGR